MQKKKMLTISFVFLILTILVLYLTYYVPLYFLRFPIEYEEFSRLRSPDSKLDAVLMRGNSGAMSSFSYYLYVVPAGCKISKKDIRDKRYQYVFAAEKMEGENVAWLMDNILEIKYTKARIFAFRNYARPLPHYEVEIRETPITSSSLPWDR